MLWNVWLKCKEVFVQCQKWKFSVEVNCNCIRLRFILDTDKLLEHHLKFFVWIPKTGFLNRRVATRQRVVADFVRVVVGYFEFDSLQSVKELIQHFYPCHLKSKETSYLPALFATCSCKLFLQIVLATCSRVIKINSRTVMYGSQNCPIRTIIWVEKHWSTYHIVLCCC